MQEIAAAVLYLCTVVQAIMQPTGIRDFVLRAGCKLFHVCTFRLIVYDTEQLCKT